MQCPYCNHKEHIDHLDIIEIDESMQCYYCPQCQRQIVVAVAQDYEHQSTETQHTIQQYLLGKETSDEI